MPAKTTTGPAETTTRTYDCNHGDGTFPSPYDCTEFYVCSNGYTHVFQCPAGLYYDPKHHLCNYPWLVDCDVHAVDPVATTMEPAETTEPATTSSKPDSTTGQPSKGPTTSAKPMQTTTQASETTTS